MKITFNFDSGLATIPSLQQATACCELSDEQYVVLENLRETANVNHLSHVEAHLPALQWTFGVSGYQPSELVVDPIRGLSLIARSEQKDAAQIKSAWIDWGTLDLTWVLENNTPGALIHTNDKEVARHELQSV